MLVKDLIFVFFWPACQQFVYLENERLRQRTWTQTFCKFQNTRKIKQNCISYILYLLLTFLVCFCMWFTGNGSSPAQNSTRSISPNNSTTNSQFSLQHNSSGSLGGGVGGVINGNGIAGGVGGSGGSGLGSPNGVGGGGGGGSCTPTSLQPQVCTVYPPPHPESKLISLFFSYLQSSLTTFKQSPTLLNGNGSLLDANMPGGIPTPGTPNSKAKVSLKSFAIYWFVYFNLVL